MCWCWGDKAENTLFVFSLSHSLVGRVTVQSRVCCILQAAGSIREVPRPMEASREAAQGRPKLRLGKGSPGGGNGLGKGVQAERRFGICCFITEWEGRVTGDQAAE